MELLAVLPHPAHPLPVKTWRDRFAALLALILCTCAGKANEWWGWTSLEFWRQERARAWLFMGNRLDLSDGPYVQIVSPRFKYELLPWLDVATGQSALSIENTKTDERHFQWRPELELNPHWNPIPSVAIEFRNRMEWRWNEGEAFTTHRSRQRLQVAWTLPHPLGPLTRVFASNEWLTDLHRHQWTENRLVPAGLTFKLGSKANLDVFYMLVSSRAQPDWRQESVLGTYLRVRL
jgi:hypothetical protein